MPLSVFLIAALLIVGLPQMGQSNIPMGTLRKIARRTSTEGGIANLSLSNNMRNENGTWLRWPGKVGLRRS
jgi:hypothetical protein